MDSLSQIILLTINCQRSLDGMLMDFCVCTVSLHILMFTCKHKQHLLKESEGETFFTLIETQTLVVRERQKTECELMCAVT